MNDHRFFYLGLTCMLMHEMDAIRCKEWRIFPGLSILNDVWGYRIFMLVHIPLFFFLFKGLTQLDNSRLIFGLDVFFGIHVGLHLLFLLHKKNDFKDWISWTLIFGAGMFGFLDLFFMGA
jgi:hypothetical protein